MSSSMPAYRPPPLPVLSFMILALVVLGCALVYLPLSIRKLPYPPGPLAQSFIAGNMCDLPTTYTWRTFIEWGKKYGMGAVCVSPM